MQVLFLVSSLSVNKRQLVIENLLQRDSTRGAIETKDGLTVARDESFPCVVAEAKLTKAIAAAGKDSMREWSKSRKE